jgi:general secretion pathway protein H
MPGRSATGDQSDSGFTLLELLVVIAIMALMSVAIPIALPHLLPQQRLRSDSQSLATGLREARADAATLGRPVELKFDPVACRLERTGHMSVWAPSRGISVTAQMTGSEPSALRFFPDGSSSGGTYVLALADARVTIKVSPMTGRIRVDGR